jgi:hypothetical protein
MKTHIGRLSINKDQTIDFEEITGYLSVHSNAQLIAPNLKTITEDLDIYPNAQLTAPNLSSVGDLYIHPSAQLTAPKLCPIKLKEGDFFRLGDYTYKFVEYTRKGMIALNVDYGETNKINHQYYSKILTDKEIAEVIAEKMVG